MDAQHRHVGTVNRGCNRWLKRPTYLPSRANVMDYSKYRNEIKTKSFQERVEHEKAHASTVPAFYEISGPQNNPHSRVNNTFPLTPEPSPHKHTGLHESGFHFQNETDSFGRGHASTALPRFPPRLPFPERLRLTKPTLQISPRLPILQDLQLSFGSRSFLNAADFREAERIHRRGIPRSTCDLLKECSLEDLVPKQVLQDHNFENMVPDSLRTQETREVCEFWCKMFSGRSTHEDRWAEILRDMCPPGSSFTSVAGERCSQDGMPRHRKIKTIDFEDDIFIPKWVDEEQCPSSSRQMVGIQNQGSQPYTRSTSCHQRSTTVDSGISFCCSLLDPLVDKKWRSNSRQKTAVSNNHPRRDVADPLIHESESRRHEIIKLPRWRPLSPPPSASFQESPQPISLPDPPTPRLRERLHPCREAAAIASQIRVRQLELISQHGPDIFQPFIPSRILLEGAEGEARAHTPPITPQTTRSMPPNSPCTVTQPYFQPLIRASENTALWLTHIPASATYADVLAAVRGGRVYICALSPPLPGAYRTCACKLVFFTREAAEAFYARANAPDDVGTKSGGGEGMGGGDGDRHEHLSIEGGKRRSDGTHGGIVIQGARIRCVWNRILYPAYAPKEKNAQQQQQQQQSRVLIIRGEARLMSFAFFEDFFARRFRGDVECRFEMRHEVGRRSGERAGWTTHVWRFASLRAQAELAKVALEREMGGIFQVEYGVDPCDRPW